MAERGLGPRMLRHLPLIEEALADKHDFMVIQKSAQVGITEMLVNLALWAASHGWAERGNVLYVMPNQAMVEEFAATRVDSIISESRFLSAALRADRRGKQTDNRQTKRFDRGTIYFRGTGGKASLSSVPIDVAIIDEFDLMEDLQSVLERVRQRLTSSSRRRLIVASTPTLPESGINGLFLQSDQRHYYLPCPRCGIEQPLRWPESVDFERCLVVCSKCRAVMDRQARGRWVAEAPGNAEIHGYSLNRLYSPWLDLRALIQASKLPGPRAQEYFHNSDLGEPFVPPGTGLTIAALDGVRFMYDRSDYDGGPCVMGVDVGIKLHLVIRACPPHGQHQGDERRRLWFAGIVDTFEQLDDYIERFNVRVVVVDHQPEMHKAEEFAGKHRSKVWLAHYDHTRTGWQELPAAWGEQNRIRANRTHMLEATFERFHQRQLQLPQNARQLGGDPDALGIGEYYREMTALKRHLERDANGDWASRWDDNGKDDHFAHAELYALLAEKSYLKPRGGEVVIPMGMELSSWPDPPGYRERMNLDSLDRRSHR
jgi:hypothetical protein